MPGTLLASIAKDFGTSGAIAACADLIDKCVQCGTIGGIAAVLGSTGAAVAPYAALLVLGEFTTWRSAKRDKAALQAQLRELHASLHRIEQAQSSNEDWRSLLDELLGQRIQSAEQLDPNTTIAQIRATITEHGETITAEINTGFDHIRIYLSKIATDAERAADNTDAIRIKQDEHSQNFAEMKSMLGKLLAARPEDSQPDPSLDRDLASAVQRLADDAARGVHTAERVLETNDPNAIPIYLKARRTKLVEAQAALNERITAEAIQIDRELAATAYVTGQIDEATEALERILSLAPNDLDAINQLGHIYRLQGNLHASETQYKRLLQLDPSEATKAVAFGNLGVIETARGNLDAAEGYHKRSLAIDVFLGHKEGVACCLNNLGRIDIIRGNLGAAEVYHKRSLAIYQTLGHKEGMANSFDRLGLIERRRGNLDAAENHHKHSLTIYQTLGHKQGMAGSLGNLGLTETARGNLETAEDYLKRCLSISQTLGHKEGIASSLGNLGLIETARGNLDAAEDYHIRSLALEEDLGSKEGVACTLGSLGEIEITRGNLDAAQKYLTRSLSFNEALGRKEGMATCFGNLGGIEMERGNLDAARNLWTRSRDLYTQIGMPHMAAQLQSWLDTLPDQT